MQSEAQMNHIPINQTDIGVGATFGSIVGLLQAINGQQIMIVAFSAVASGFLGAAGAHLFKIIIAKIRKKK